MTKYTSSPQHRVYASFFIYAVTLGGIFPRLGDLQQQMGISEGTLGAALVGLAIGTQISLMFAGPLLERIGYRISLILCIPLLGMAEVVASMALTPQFFFLCLMVGGLAIGALEIIVNLEADRTEHLMGRRIMNRSHAFWSFGFFAAGLVSAGVSQFNITPTIHLAGMAVVTSVLMFGYFYNFVPAQARVVEEGPAPKFVRPTSAVLMLVLFTLSAMMLEGGSADWSVIFMRDTFDTSPLINTLAFAVGAFTQALSRYFADHFVDKFGPIKIAKLLITTLGVGVVMVTISPNPVVALCGFALMGVGTSAMFPLAMSAAAQRTDRPAATNVASVAQLSFVTFLIAPPLLGLIAEHFGIRYSFGVGIPLVVVSWFALPALKPDKS